ncbi:predicted protein [Streptomyces viridochromogenes DSM 40736]|uniref:Predicted protein n=1 Tax=Streptomyces viridochromogenes (strain DSM 40736 / JCM 4977 / BCRC 1201 / Tue 494) TaxID=591159 RepID=D9XE96_STRVT|nr:predicted protein [Streptomyces viridochromogenes DSM 40736]
MWAARGERGVVSDRAGDVGCLRAGRRARDRADALALMPLRVSPSGSRTHCGGRPTRAVGSEPIGPPTGHPHTCGLSRYGNVPAGALPPYPGFPHMRWPIWSRSRRHSD